jgi:hypothetical protein
MKSDIRHWALVGYLLLTVYLLARPSAQRLQERAADLDTALAAEQKAVVAPALAKVLDVPNEAVECHLSNPEAKPSDLVFVKLVQNKRGVAQPGVDAKFVMENGLSMNEALDYFEDIQTKVIRQIESATPTVARRDGNWFASALFGSSRK